MNPPPPPLPVPPPLDNVQKKGAFIVDGFLLTGEGLLLTRLSRLLCKIITLLQQTCCNYWYIFFLHFFVLFVLSAAQIVLLGIRGHHIVTMVQAVLVISTNGLRG